jgi:hypothetical protein
MQTDKKYTAFLEERIVASGELAEVLPKLKRIFDRDRSSMVLIFDDETGKAVDFDLQGSLEDVLARNIPQPTSAGPGRPRLGVVSREVTLLPRQWEWLELQPNGASAAIRRLVDEARKREPAKARKKQAIQAAGRFLSSAAGNYPGYEEASRALYREEDRRLAELMHRWPKDIRNYALRLVRGSE